MTLARIDAGLHFLESMVDGSKMASRINDFMLERHFKRASPKQDR